MVRPGELCFFGLPMPGVGIQDPVPDSVWLKQGLVLTDFLNPVDLLGVERINMNSHIFRMYHESDFSHINHDESCQNRGFRVPPSTRRKIESSRRGTFAGLIARKDIHCIAIMYSMY
jgi:hypothetical protein